MFALSISFVTALLAASSVSARNAPLGQANNYVAPLPLQIGSLSQLIACNATFQGSTVASTLFNGLFGNTEAISVGRTQNFFVTGRLRLIGNQNFTTGLANAGVTSISNGKLLNLVINAPGTSTGAIDIAATRTVNIPAQNIVRGQPVIFDFPNTNEPTFQFGPFTPASTGSTITLSFGRIVANITINAFGQALAGTLTCPTLTIPNPIAAIPIGGSDTATIGPNPDFVAVTGLPDQSSLRSSSANYQCTIPGVTSPNALPLSFTAFSPRINVTRNQGFQLFNAHGTVNVSQAFIANLQATLPTGGKATAFQLNVLSFNTTTTGLSASTVRVIANPSLSNVTQLASTTGTYRVDIPGQNGVFPPVNYTAGATPGTALIFLGNTAININALNSAGTVLRTFAATCTSPATPVAFFPITVL